VINDYLVASLELLQQSSAHIIRLPVDNRRMLEVNQWLARILMGLLLGWIIFSGVILSIEFPVGDLLIWRILPGALGCFGLAGLSMVIRHQPGTFWRLLFSSPILLGLVIVIFVPLLPYKLGQLSSETIWALIMLPGDFIIFPLVAWLGAEKDSPPLGSFTAPFAYLGRYAHLRGLAVWAAEQGWQTKGPKGYFRDLMVQGSWHSHPVSILSSEKLHGKGNPDRFLLSISLACEENLWPLIAGYRASELAEKLDLEEFHGVMDSERSFDYYFRQDNDSEVVDETSILLLHNTLGRGATLLGEHGLLFSSKSGITLQQFGNWRLRQDKADIEEALLWMSRVIIVMESQGFISKRL
jgi:hypothetical protein